MSYRSFKHLLGETSLERKCRFIFGGGILVLVTLSFYWYGQKTESLVIGQTTQAARMLVKPIVMNLHYKSMGNEDFASVIDVLWGDLHAARRPARVRGPHPQPVQAAGRQARRKRDDFEQAALARFLRAAAAEAADPQGRQPRASRTPSPTARRCGSGVPDRPQGQPRKEYQYIQAVLFKPSCLMDCHGGPSSSTVNNHTMREEAGGKWVTAKAGDLAGAVVVNLPMEQTNKAIHRNRAILITAALVTAILAMVASYVIVRYVIVKPVKHLRDVSDAIAAGKLNDPQPDPDRRRVRGALARLQPDAPQPGRHAAGAARRSTTTSTARSTSWPRPTSPSSR